MVRTASPAIEVHDLTVRYGTVTAVDGASFVVGDGELVALLGPNGAGKTTTVECLEGYRRPDEGQVRVLGLDPVADHAALTARMGVMLQGGGIANALRPAEAVRQFASFYDDPEDPDELLDRVGLAERRSTAWRRLSGGEQQRLSLALALVGRPQVVFLDEPTAGIDAEGRQLIRALVAGLRERDVTVLLTTHDLDEAERLADRVVIIDRGRVLADATPAQLTASTGTDRLRFAARPGLDLSALASSLGVEVVETTPGEYCVDAAPEPSTIAAVTSWLAAEGIALDDLRAGRQRLEDVFLQLTREARAEVEPTTEPARGRRRR